MEKFGKLSLVSRPFEARDGKTVDAEWGTLVAPENRAANKTNAIELAFVRFGSTTRYPAAPIVFLAGGPGKSGIEVAAGRHFDFFMALRGVADVIVMDQRGVGASRPCLDSGESWQYPLDVPADGEELLRVARDHARKTAKRLRRGGVDLGGYNSLESAEDVELLRSALDVPALSLIGHSYGTHLALSYIRRYRRHVDRAVLAGLEGPDQTLE